MSTPKSSQKVEIKILSEGERKAIIARCRRALLGLGWQHPFFLPAAARVCIKVCNLPSMTAAADALGNVYIDPNFIGPEPNSGIPDKELQGVLGHELYHLMLMHHGRRQGRNPQKWNRCTDRAINASLRIGGIALPAWVLYPDSGDEDKSSEELYLKEEDQPSDGNDGQGKGQGGQGNKVGGGCGVGDPVEGAQGEGEGEGEGSDRQGAGESFADAARTWREVAAQARVLDREARQQGQGHGNSLARLLDFPPAKIRWDQVLRGEMARAIAAHGYDDYTYARRNRRTQLAGPIFPGTVTYRAQVAVVIDTSGSMSDKALERCVANTVAISKAMRVRLFLVTHDDGVQWAGWIAPSTSPKAIAAKCVGRGGTSFEAAYRKVEESGRFDALVHLTDGGVGHWPDKPANCRKLVVALFGWGCKDAVPKSAKLIETELDQEG